MHKGVELHGASFPKFPITLNCHATANTGRDEGPVTKGTAQSLSRFIALDAGEGGEQPAAQYIRGWDGAKKKEKPHV